MKKLILLICLVAVLVFIGYKIATSGEPGYIKLDVTGAIMQLSRDWWSRVTVSSDTEKIKVKTGTYRPRRLEIVKEGGGNKWRIFSSGPWGDLRTVKVRKDETTVLKPGEPFFISANVRQQRQSGSRLVSIGISIIGRAGEHYSSRIAKNGRDVGAPKLKIVDESGKVLASGKFKYG
ncbi:MAG: hypothetical protein ACYS83_10385 [Planctomycetota bacterium]|jgi:hypothetical protein